MERKNSLAKRLFGEDSDIFNRVFDDFGFSSFFTDLYEVKPEYDLKDCGDKYSYTIDYNPQYDHVSVDVDEEDRTVTVTVRQDFNKSNSTFKCKYYGKYITTLPEDCETDWEKEIDEKNGKMTISFNKGKKSEDGVKNAESDESFDYKEKYENLRDSFEGELDALKKEIDKLNNENNRLVEKLKNAYENNNVLEKKLNKIRNMF